MALDRGLPLNALRAFEATARQGSLSAAASELQVSVAAVSRHVALLEAQLGCKLFRRTRNGVEPTERGRLFYPNIAEAFARIESAHGQLVSDRLGGELFVSLYTSFAVEWLAPRLHRFRCSFPEIDLRLKISTGEADFDSDRVDLALTSAQSGDRRLHYDHVFDSCVVPVCTPAFAETARLDCVERLAGQVLLYEARESLFWQLWFDGMGLAPPRLDRGMRFDSASHAYQVARSGGGIALMQTFYLPADFGAGRLVTPVPWALPVPLTHRLACRRNRMDQPLLRAFRLWLLAEAGEGRAAAAMLPVSVMDPTAGGGGSR